MEEEKNKKKELEDVAVLEMKKELEETKGNLEK